ncbi:MAG: DUF1653 domain-containing protein [Alphaproteobacteria bacterium]|nr:DUF1653 domain-containing protein [Alphaproteobacteria bacterium]
MADLELGLYQHYKGNFYQVIGLCRHSESLNVLVAYQDLYGDYGLWVRPLEIFQSAEEQDGKQVPRFKFIGSLKKAPPVLLVENSSLIDLYFYMFIIHSKKCLSGPTLLLKRS